MNRVEILEQVRRFKRKVESLPDSRIKIEAEPPMTEPEAIDWIQRQAEVQCPHCGRYYAEKGV